MERRIRAVLVSRSGVANLVFDNVSCEAVPITLSINDVHKLVICKSVRSGEKIGKSDILYVFDSSINAVDFCKSLAGKCFYREEVHFMRGNDEYYNSFRLKVDDDLFIILKVMMRSLK